MSPVNEHPFNSWHHFHFLSVAGAFPFSSTWALEGSLGWYWRDSHYPAPYADVHAVNPIALLVLQYNP